jgi:diacylglycerol kinase family enzyme
MLVMAVGNNRLAGGGFEVAPKARLDDGLLGLAEASRCRFLRRAGQRTC